MTTVNESGTVATQEYVEPAGGPTVVEQPTSVIQPATRVVEEPAPAYVESPTYVRRGNPMANTMAASAMIQTLVWSAVVIVLLVVGILVLIHYHII